MRGILLLFIAVFCLNACATIQLPAKVSRSPGWYTIKKSDTLYSIAWRYGLDYKKLAAWNNIRISDPIFPGQRLRLSKPVSSGLVQGGSNTRKSKPTPTSQTRNTSTENKTASNDVTSWTDPVRWRWPTDGKVMNTFSSKQLDRRGIEITGREGQPVYAVADGRVVYSGNGLAGYGNLIIIKHSDTFLSAYAYCQERLVQEGTVVKSGKILAKMGVKDSVAKLYFEIRRNGKPVDPIRYLPKR